jgi:hypothetical protein
MNETSIAKNQRKSYKHNQIKERISREEAEDTFGGSLVIGASGLKDVEMAL